MSGLRHKAHCLRQEVGNGDERLAVDWRRAPSNLQVDSALALARLVIKPPTSLNGETL